MNVEEELDKELEDYKKNLPEAVDEEIFLYITNNFYIRIPGGDYYRMYEDGKFVRHDSDEKIVDCMRNFCSQEQLDAFLKNKSETLLSKTFGELKVDMAQALREEGMSEETLKELSEVKENKGTYKIINRDRKTFVRILYKAYRNLRKKGYSREDLI